MSKSLLRSFIQALFSRYGLIVIPAILAYLIHRRYKKQSVAKAILLKALQKYNQRNALLTNPLPQPKISPEKLQEILNAPVTKLVEMLNNDEVTSENLVLIFCERARTIGLSYHLIADTNFKEALEVAKECDKKRQSTPKENRKELGPLFGIPISIKDNLKVKGLDATFGLTSRCFQPQIEDAALVAVLKKNGAIPFTKTNVPQMMMTIESVNNIFGRARNPWNPERTVGGSSGGEAGMVAARCSPLGIGTDVAGSVRTPALYCGVYGMKPTAERMSTKGLVYPNKAGRNGNMTVKSVAGPLGKCVDDLRNMLQVLMSDDLASLDPRVVNLKWNSEWQEQPLRKMRIGYVDNDDFFEVCPAIKRAVAETVEVLKQKGHELVPLNGLMPSLQRAHLNYTSIFGAEGKLRTFFNALQGEPIITEYSQWVMLAFMPESIRQLLAKILDLIGQKRASGMLSVSGGKKAYELFESVKEMEAMKDEVLELWKSKNLDAIISPGLALPAVRHGTAHSLYLNACYPLFWNLMNFPTGVLPITKVRSEETQYTNQDRKHKGDKYDLLAGECLKGSAGLPVGIQLSTLPFEDEKCLAIMKEIESGIQFHEYPL